VKTNQDNALAGNWPITEVKDGRNIIVDWFDVLDWWDRNGEYMIAESEGYGIMWYQIMGLTRGEAIAQYPEAFK